MSQASVVEVVRTVQVSDTTGDAMKYFSLLHNNSSLTSSQAHTILHRRQHIHWHRYL